MLAKQYVYVFELCSRYNKVVRDYSKPTVFLLSTFNVEGFEYGIELNNSEANYIGVNSPKYFQLNSSKEAEDYVLSVSENDVTFEGLVLRDSNGNRIKVKSAEYVRLHRIVDNGNVVHPKNILPFILKGEEDEVTTYFPEIKERVFKIKSLVEKLMTELDNIWFCHHDEPSQKKFAMEVKDHPLSSYLFTARKNNTHPNKELLIDSRCILRYIENEV